MPLRGSDHSNKSRDDVPYFRTLAELDEWAERPAKKLNAVLPYHPRSPARGTSSEGRGKLLVCHDYKGGYTEVPGALAYTFNFWSLCDIFIYFSHHRVTVPPSGWSTAAHRQGVKMLGTLIFEGEGEQDCLRLLVGRLPHGRTGPAESRANPQSSLPLSPHYAQILAQLAHQRGFDGYLLNFECPLRGGPEQTRALTAWISILRDELSRKVGAHAQVIWYDSVVYSGQLRWQDRLNSYNLPFFIPSSGFFTNYTWPPHYPSLTAQYFLSLDTALVTPSKALSDIFVGVDVWGRGSHGGGGLGCYKAISHIDPQALGLSVALFGHAWTWESEQDKAGWNWDAWWAYERKLWLGPEEGETVAVPPKPLRQGEPECPHGPFVPLASFFSRLPPPNPADLTFFTSFSPGVGRAWFVEGRNVLQVTAGWTDLDKNCSLGDMLWPRPIPSWEDGRDAKSIPRSSAILSLDDAWLGGSSVNVSMTFPGSDAEDAFFQCVWLPVQSLAITPQRSYEMTLIYKIHSDRAVDFDLGLSVKLLAPGLEDSVEVTPISTTDADDLGGGWTKKTTRFVPTCDGSTDVLAAVGVVIGFAVEDPIQPTTVNIILGSLTVYSSTISPQVVQPLPKVIWADFQSDSASPTFPGVLRWGTASAFAPLTGVATTSPEDPQPVWKIDPLLPKFSYFNIYAQAFLPTGYVPPPAQAIFIGTTGLDGRENRFFVDLACVPPSVDGATHIRFYVQGVTNRGQALDWASSAYVDVDAARS